ncbi:hypothetical protein [Streptomyces agglomeratus]|uniref:hypothetical protein n=1 Tax=Streptomyces agglomeratus TaxID=285458 RepID=UPI00114D11F1|nr:hypothetical protein [Streptomyces agglomeratus]
MSATLRAHHARTARSPCYADRRPRPARARRAVPSELPAPVSPAHRRPDGIVPWGKSRVLKGERRHSVQQAAIRRGGMAVATVWRCGTYGRAVWFPNVDRSMLSRGERIGRPRR